jgi:hypothetical protein
VSDCQQGNENRAPRKSSAPTRCAYIKLIAPGLLPAPQARTKRPRRVRCRAAGHFETREVEHDDNRQTDTMPGALAALALLLAQDAWGADNWCYRKLGDSSGNSCGAAVAPLEYCLRGALIVGGACSREQAYAGPRDEQARSQRDGHDHRRRICHKRLQSLAAEARPAPRPSRQLLPGLAT